MKKSFLVMAAVFVSALVINSNPLMAQTKTDQELAKENLELRRQNAELRDRLRRLEARNRIAASGNANQSQQQPSMSSEAAAARAADLPTKAPPPAPPPIPAHTWTGFYVGGNVGGAWGNRDVAYVLDPFSVNVFDTPPQPASFRTSGVIGGLQVGYNWQVHRNWLIGQESDFNWSNMKGSGSSPAAAQFGLAPPISFVATADEHIRWFGTFRGRLGYLPTDNLLAYVTGGFAYGTVERGGTLTRTTGGTLVVGGGAGFGIQCTGGVPCYAGSSNDVATGWTLGGGLEYAFWQNWTLKAEYLYVSLDGQSFTETATNPPPGTLPASLNANFSRPTFNLARVGMNYRF